MKSKPSLWERLNNVAFDNLDASFPFSKRLARDNDWSHEFALKVIDEYRRFAYLAMVSGHEVTPSDEVDQAWHLHLTYTRHYCGPFRHALGADFHHGPTAGGASEMVRYADNYAATLESYQREFGEMPPADVWPASEVRFGNANALKRIDTSAFFLVPMKAVRKVAAAFAAMVAGAGITATMLGIGFAQSEQVGDRLFGLSQKQLFGAGILIVILIFVLAAALNSSKKKGDGSGGCGAAGGSGCSGKGEGGGSDGGSGCGGGGCGGGGCGG